MSNLTNAPLPAAPDTATDPKPAEGGPGDRRKRQIPVAQDRRRAENAAAKRKSSERRRLIDPTTCERDYSDDETEFMKAMDRYKRENRRPFPTWSEVLEVLRSLGYRRVAETTDLPAAAPARLPRPRCLSRRRDNVAGVAERPACTARMRT